MKSLNYVAVILAVLMVLSFFVLWYEPLNPVGATDLFLSRNTFRVNAAGWCFGGYAFVRWLRGKDK